MNPASKKPGVAFWATVVVVVVLAYPLSWGPVTWARTRHCTPEWLNHAVVLPYSPLFWLAERFPTFDLELRRYSAKWYPPNYPPCLLPFHELD